MKKVKKPTKKDSDLELLHITLMLKIWKNETVLFDDYLNLLEEIDIQKSDLIFDDNHLIKLGQASIHQIKGTGSESSDRFGPFSRYIKYLDLEKKDDEFVLVIRPSDHLGSVLWDRNKLRGWRDTIGTNKFLDPILNRIDEIDQIFKVHAKKFSQSMSGKDFIDFLMEHKIYPYIWVSPYSHEGCSCLNTNNEHSWLPFSFDVKFDLYEHMRFIQNEIQKTKNVAERTEVFIKFNDL